MIELIAKRQTYTITESMSHAKRERASIIITGNLRAPYATLDNDYGLATELH
jgi:hypothetical protein